MYLVESMYFPYQKKAHNETYAQEILGLICWDSCCIIELCVDVCLFKLCQKCTNPSVSSRMLFISPHFSYFLDTLKL